MLRTADSYTPADVVSPLDGSVIRADNVKPEFQSAVLNVDRTDPALRRHYNGIELNFNARLPHGARLFGGTSTERAIANSCSAALTDPNLLTIAISPTTTSRSPPR